MHTVKQRHVDSQQQVSCGKPEILLRMLVALLASRQPVGRTEFMGISKLHRGTLHKALQKLSTALSTC